MRDETTPTDARREDVAIVGIGCRYPGNADGPDAFWRLLCDETDAIVDVPADRWETDRFVHADHRQPGRHVLRQAGFIRGVDLFDARFFGISPREAQRMDPQQRLLLEVTAEALEAAGIPSRSLAGSDTGVFVGISSTDFNTVQSAESQIEEIDAHTATGAAMSIVANRLSYVFDLRGPSVSIDTACSSSLVAVHLACAALARGECSVALAAGVNLILAPQFTICLSQAGMLSPRWRSRAFDASVDGYARGEGVGVVVLKPLSDALRDGDHVHAVIRGTAVNQDGHTPGMTMPSAVAQERAIAAACARAGVVPGDVGYVEAHGTGTPVGDPIEAEGLGRAFSVGRAPGRPLIVGSVKTNIGHLESAAGVAGLVKAALVVEHGRIPRSLHFETPNPRIPMDELNLRVAGRAQDFPGDTRLAGVNSFGFGGTNAHVVLERPPARGPAAPGPAAPWILPVSARSPEALGELLERWTETVTAATDLGSTCAAAARRRDHHPYRRAVVADDRAGLLAALATARGAAAGAAAADTPRVVFAFTGQGPQWWAMGRELLRTEPVFRAMIERCDAVMRQHGDWSLLDEMRVDEGGSRMQDTAVLQPAMFALQVALAELWRSWGVEPAAVVGHSMGEMAAAYVAGALSLEDAARVIVLRGRIQAEASAAGGMAFVALPAAEALAEAHAVDPSIAVGAYNSPVACTLSGDRKALERVVARLNLGDVFARMVRVNCACHSADMDPFREELLEVLKDVRPRPTRVPFYSTVTGGLLAGPELGATYWWDNFRQPVAFAQAAAAVLADGFDTFVELGPHSVLVGALRECLREAGRPGLVVPSLLRDRPERGQMLAALGRLYEQGVSPDWRAVYPGVVPPAALPAYPWRHERFWSERPASRAARIGRGDHPLLERRLGTAAPAWETRLDRPSLAWVKDHEIQGEVVVPGAAYLETALAAARVALGGEARLEEVEFKRVLVLPETPPRAMHVELSPSDRSFAVQSRAVGEDGGWVEHAVGRYASASAASKPARDLAAVRSRCTRPIDVDPLFEALIGRGYLYGPAFRGLTGLWAGDDEYVGRVEAPPSLEDLASYRFHPAVLDACLQVMLAHSGGRRRDTRTFLPVGVGRLELHAPVSYPLWAHARIVGEQRDSFFVDLAILDDAGRMVAQITKLHARAVSEEVDTEPDPDEHLYAHRWTSRPLPGEAEQAPGAFLPEPAALAAAVRPQAEALYRDLDRARWYATVRERTDALAAAYALQAVRALGADLAQPYLPVDLEERVTPPRRALFRRLLAILAEDGVLAREGERWRVRRVPDTAEAPAEAAQRLLWAHPDNLAELDLLRRCGEALPRVLTGETNPLQVIFPDGTLGVSAALYQDAPVTRVYNLLARAVLRSVVERLPEGRPLRVLEIGAGTGGLTGHLLGVLPPERTRYVFTDVSPHFFNKAQERFREQAFLECRLLDIDRDPIVQGFEAGAYDVVVASDAVHATPDLRRSLGHARALLAPGGLLLLIEAQPPSRVLDLTFGMTDGWWAFSDADLRTTSPLLPPAAWERTLRDAGFVSTASLVEAPDGEVAAQAVLLARAPDAAPERPALPERKGRWIVCADNRGVAARFARRLLADGNDVTLVLDPAVPAGAAGGLSFVRGDALPLDPMPTDVIGFWAVGESADDAPGTLRAGCAETLRTVQQVVASLGEETPRLWLVTAGAWPDAGRPPRLTGRALWGLGGTLVNELPRLRCTLVDLPDTLDDDALDALAREARVDDGERELRLSTGRRLARRLVRLAPEETVERDVRGMLVRGSVLHRGSADSLTLRRHPRVPPGPGQVEVELRASALNFRDLMVSLGLVPVEDDDQAPGGEGAGVVVAVGDGVTGVQPGDRVVVLAATGKMLATHVTVDASNLYALPDEVDFTTAAGLPTVYVTALIALRELARLEPGEIVLVHAGSGGLGLAALQVARMLGARVFATAGSHEKRAFLRGLGVELVMDSRSLEFADEIRACTQGRGVDVVLNCLGGDAIARSVACLAPYGRFVEVGKRDLVENARLGLRPFLRNLSYFALDVASLLVERPAYARRFVEEVLSLVARGVLPGIPSRTQPLAEARAALRSLAAARHVGKLLVSPIGGGDERALPVERRLELPPDGAYLVTGGLGGFGLATAEWLVDRGAKHVVLVGRRGVADPAAVERMQARGATVQCEAVDVSDDEAVRALIGRVHSAARPLRGVFHAAMVLEDLPVLRIDEAQLERVFAPKARGAWHLHRHTAHCPLDHFVLFSSASALVGNPGQANYIAANAFVDGLAHLRRAQGRPALSVNWGMLQDVGYVSRHGNIARRLETQGMLGFSSAWAFRALERLIDRRTTQAGLLRMDWGRWITAGSDVFGQNPLYSRLRAEVQASIGVEVGDAGGAQAPRGLVDRLHAQVARVLGLPTERLDREASLTTLGIDSLLGAEIAAWIRREAGVEISMMALMKGPSVSELAHLVEQQRGDAPSTRAQARTGNRWTRCVRPLPQPRARLLCFPFLGGGATVFEPWADAWPDIEVHGVQLPGHEGRRDEPPVDRMATLVEGLAEGLRPLLDRPFAIYGHSLGSQMAFALAVHLERGVGRAPVALFAAAFQAPGRPTMFGDLHRWPDAALAQITDRQLLDELQARVLPEAVVRDPAALAAEMPGMRASSILAMRYRPDPATRVTCPIHALVAADDPGVSPADMERWRECTTGPFSAETLDGGGHLFLLDRPRVVIRAVDAVLARLLPAPPG